MLKNGKLTIVLFLMAVFALSTVVIPTASPHTPAWEIPTHAYINVSPNPIGVGQTAFIVFWVDRIPMGAVVGNNIRLHNYELTIYKPDGTSETKKWDYISDTTSSQYYLYTPSEVGNYSFVFKYPGEKYTYNQANTPGIASSSAIYENDTFLPSTSRTATLIVQQDQLPTPISSYPLPTEYWTRPIEAENTDWWRIASNWLGTASPPISGWSRVQKDGIAPNSAHVMWTKPIQDAGGVVGGTNTGIEGNMYYMGMSYNQRFSNPIIMYGKLYYAEPYGNAATGWEYVCVDIRTGLELWRTNTTGIGVPSFGYLYDYEMYNQHGIVPEGWLFTSNFARSYDPSNGVVTTLNITNVPTGTTARSPTGEHLRYIVTNAGTTANPDWRLLQWNSSKVFEVQTSGNIIGNVPLTPTRPTTTAPSGQTWSWNGTAWAIQSTSQTSSVNPSYDWNVSIPALPGLSNPSIIQAFAGDCVFGRSTTFLGVSVATSWGTPDPYTFWALNLNSSKGQIGSLMWIKNYTAPAGNHSLIQGPVNPETRIFTMYEKETFQWYGYSLDTGALVWGPVRVSVSDWDYYESYLVANIAYGKLYYSGYAGILYCLDAKTGDFLWTYGNGEEGNSTNSGLYNTWGDYPIWIGAIADGKVYLHTSEHSPNTPLYKNAKIRCVDANTGKEIWSILGFGGVAGASQMAEAEGFLVYLNCYDMQIYSIGKGPSATTVEAPTTSVSQGSSVVIRGRVIDISAGTKQPEQAARFPNGVPAMSDESMGKWMEYVYIQKPKPTDATGVPVKIDVIDSNNNLRTIGTVTSDSSGMFTLSWKPDIEGDFKVIATFEGSESYWPSYAETSFAVDSPAPTPSPHAETVLPPTEMYFAASTAAIIVAIAIGFAITILVLKKRP